MSRFLRWPSAVDASASPAQAGKTVADDDAQSLLLPPPTHDIIVRPSAACQAPTPVTYTAEQTQVMVNVKVHLLVLHADLHNLDVEYVPWERRWIEDPSTARRYAKAVGWDEGSAKKRAADTLAWRREYKPDLIVPDSVKQEGETGKHILSGFDKQARPCLYLRPGRENTAPNPQQIRFLVFDLERAIDFCPPSQDKITLVIDYHKATKATQPSFSTQLKVLHILQNHYPERLGLAIVVNVPWFLSTFFAAISPFLDPITRDKIRMLRSPERVKESIPVDQLDAEFGGAWRYDFHFERYWQQIIDFCGIASDGTRLHDSKARMMEDESNEVAPQHMKEEERLAERKAE